MFCGSLVSLIHCCTTWPHCSQDFQECNPANGENLLNSCTQSSPEISYEISQQDIFKLTTGKENLHETMQLG